VPRLAVLGRERNRVARLVAVAQSRDLAAVEARLPFTGAEREAMDVLVLDAGALSAEDRLWVKGVLAESGITPVIVVTDAADLSGAESLVSEGVDDVLDWTTLTSASLARAVRLTLARQTIHAKPVPAPNGKAAAVPSALTLLQECASALMMVDPDGIVRFANPEAEELLGVPEGSLTGAPFALAVDKGAREEVVLDGPDGRQVHAEVRVVETEHGDVPMRVVTLQDMSLRRALERHFAA
jgi:PAS domain-containing protein